MLIIPLIKIYYGLSPEKISGDGCKKLETLKPSDLAVIFRGENFKSLHIVLAYEDKIAQLLSFTSIQEIISRVDIPVTVAAYKFNYEEIVELFKLGCHGVSINFPRNQENITMFEKLVTNFSTLKIFVRFNILNEILYDVNWTELPFDIQEGYKFLEELKVHRVFISCYTNKDTGEIDYDFLKFILPISKIKKTLIGGIDSYQKLIDITQFKNLGLDSVVIGNGLYENKFACQKLWRLNEVMLDDLGPTRRI